MEYSLVPMAAQHQNYLFLVTNGFPPPVDEDFEVLNLGEHTVFRTGVHVPEASVDKFDVWDKLRKYWDYQNAAVAPFFKFYPFKVDCFDCDHCGGTHLYISIYQ